jgi:hypothetical protein
MLHHIENHIETMRKKPEHIRRQYALAVSVCFILILFGFWIAGKRTPTNEATALAKPMQPIKTLTASVGDAFDYAKTFFVNGNKTKYDAQNQNSNIEVLPGKI